MSHKPKHLISEQALSSLMTEQYYNYISLLKLSNNFQKRLQLYSKIDFDYYQGNVSLIGNITEFSNSQINKKYVYPIVNTPINKYLFISQKNNPYGKRPQMPIKRKIVVRQENYIKQLLVTFNKILSISKKQKDPNFIFTHLNLYLKEDGELCFALTEHSQIIQLQNEFYKSTLQPLEASLQYNFSQLNLQSIYPNTVLQRESTFSVQEVRGKINENINTVYILGQLRRIDRQSYEKAVNAKEKQVVLDIVQDSFSHEYTSVGQCRIYIRFDILDEHEMIQHMQQGCIYVFLISDIMLTDSIQLLYKLNHWKTNMLKVTSKPSKILPIDDYYKAMKIGSLSMMSHPCIYRNMYKFKVVKTDLKFMYLKVSCQKCGENLLRINQDDYRCKNQCGIVRGVLKIWTIIGCMDHSGYAELTLEDQQALFFFGLEYDAHKIKDQTLKEEEALRKGVTLFYKKHKENPNEEEFQDALIYDKNPYLHAVLNKCQVDVIEREVIGTAKPSSSQNFSNFNEGTKTEYQTSYAKSKEYLKKAKIFLNGQFRTFFDRSRLVPHLKAERVYTITI